MKILDRLSKSSTYFYIGIFGILLKSILDHSNLIPLTDKIDDLISIVSVLFLFISCLKKEYPYKALFWSINLILLALLTSLNARNVSFFIPIIVIVASYKEDIIKLLKFIFYCELVLFIIHIIIPLLLSFNGFEIYFIKSHKLVLTFGYSHPNILSLTVLNLISMWIWLNYKTITNKDYIIISIISIITYLCTNSRTPLFTLIILFGLLFISKFDKLEKLFDIAKITFPLCAFLTIFSVYLYPNDYTIVNFFNKLFTRRIQLGSEGLLSYGASVVGQHVKYRTGFTFDNIYSSLYVHYGMIWIVIISVLFYMLAKKKNNMINIFIILWSFYGMTEIHGMNPFKFFPLLLIVYLFDYEDTLVTIKEGTIRYYHAFIKFLKRVKREIGIVIDVMIETENIDEI